MNEANQITPTTTLYGFIAESAQPNRFSVVLNKRFKTDAVAGHEAMMIPMNIRPDDFYFTLSNIKKSKVSGAVLGSEYQTEALELLDAASERVQRCGACDAVRIAEGKLQGDLLAGDALRRYLEAQGAKRIALLGAGMPVNAFALASKGFETAYFDANVEGLMALAQRLGLGEIDINRCAEGMAVDLSGYDALLVAEEIGDLAMVTALPPLCIDLKTAREVSALRQRCKELGAQYSGYETLLEYYCDSAYEFFRSEKEKA